jgi:hypothetical protein
MQNCLVCQHSARTEWDFSNEPLWLVDCPICGQFEIDDAWVKSLPVNILPRLKYKIRKMTGGKKHKNYPIIEEELGRQLVACTIDIGIRLMYYEACLKRSYA